ncbi:PREDICTED: inositol 1,4,5-trisphosphate receptor-interacting protein-like 1 [Apaloderma vittatum]|uniref:inositol 1,4,5-trisphosphate receptor-interacting protein-like 1 n=1 Tax=Apaloderma vittatum TaxID=57397 RepID=UPI00052131F0|nr:PREDICTED: inositol 1,4,5-trisphosphate receptor-interacting protein-like 1 [Apaloderma vittatum]
MCSLVEELVNKLLRTCQMLSRHQFTPQLQPVVGLGGFREICNALPGEFFYLLLVPLKAPPGHSFHLERGTEGEMPQTISRLRVDLECMCTRERCLGDVLCFLHHSDYELWLQQEPSLLQTLCSDSYLDAQKTAFWLQALMSTACKSEPWAATHKLTVLPTTCSCKMKLTSTFRRSLCIELILAVQEEDSSTFVPIG